MTGRRQGGRRWAFPAAVAGLCIALEAQGQGLRFHGHRDIAIPDYATVRIGPFYAAVVFYQSVGWRYGYSYGSGTGYLYENRRGRIVKDGHEFPMISSLEVRNYLIISPTADLDASVRVTYEHYPMKTQQDEFRVDLGDEGVFAAFSSEFALTPYLKGTAYEDAAYRTDFIDTRGLKDPFGGSRYEYFENRLGLDMDWLMAKDKNLALSASRSDLIPFTPEFQGQERVTYAESAVYEQTVMQGVTVAGGGQFSQTDYGGTNDTLVTIENYTLTVNMERGAGMRLGRASTLAVGVGYSRGDAWTDGRTNRTSVQTFTGLAALHTELTRRLSHTLRFQRSLAVDFNYPLVVLDAYTYEMAWRGDMLTVDAHTGLTVVDPVRRDWLGYRNWETGAGMTVPITTFASFRADSSYALRENENPELARAENLDTEWTADYATWYARAALVFALTQELSLEAFAQHVERFSGATDLEYGRRFYGVTLAYTHAF